MYVLNIFRTQLKVGFSCGKFFLIVNEGLLATSMSRPPDNAAGLTRKKIKTEFFGVEVKDLWGEVKLLAIIAIICGLILKEIHLAMCKY